MEPVSKAIILGMASAGDTITKNTSVSILLVVGLIAATITVTTLMRDVQNDVSNVKQDVEDIKSRQNEIYQYVTGNPLPPNSTPYEAPTH